MTDYIEQTFRTSDSEEIILNTSSEFEGNYEIGTYVDHSAEFITVTVKDLHDLADFIKTHIPEPSVLDTAKFIRAQDVNAVPRTLAKFDGLWYDEQGDALTSEQVDQFYDFIEEII